MCKTPAVQLSEGRISTELSTKFGKVHKYSAAMWRKYVALKHKSFLYGSVSVGAVGFDGPDVNSP